MSKKNIIKIVVVMIVTINAAFTMGSANTLFINGFDAAIMAFGLCNAISAVIGFKYIDKRF